MICFTCFQLFSSVAFWFGAKHEIFDFPMQDLKVIRLLEVILNRQRERKRGRRACMCVREKEQTHTCINAKAYYNSQAQTRISIHKPFNGLQNAAKGRMKDGQSGNEIETALQKGCYLNTASQISESDYTPNSRSKLNQ